MSFNVVGDENLKLPKFDEKWNWFVLVEALTCTGSGWLGIFKSPGRNGDVDLLGR